MASKGLSLKDNRRVLYAIVALTVAVAVLLVGVAYYLDVHRYPSEETPLVLQAWGISWVREQVGSDYGGPAPPFENITLRWTEDISAASYGTSPLDSRFTRVSIDEFEMPGNVTVLFETYLVLWYSDDTVDGVRVIGAYGIFITDGNEDGLFDYGDAISLFHGVYEDGVLVRQGFQGNTEYGIALKASGVGIGIDFPAQFKYAIHHGTLYAWEEIWCP